MPPALLAMADQASAGGLQLAISRLSWLECRVGPLRRRDAEALARFDAFFLHPDLEWVELSPAVVERATLLRAELNLRTPDALQAASCLQLGADAVMVTGDAGFQRVPTLRLALVNGVEDRD
ncbi:MAG: PIN domain-containing protein [Synechococcaceae bacterium WB4_1_0192]|nr:PIN domain-containing protein [Synechococcaceae bacterium WB4_1_0192]